MAAIKVCFIFLFTFLCHDVVQSQTACPFNQNECKCNPTNPPTDPLTFDTVVCQAATFPNFTSSAPDTKYTIKNSMTINGRVQIINANAMSIFNSIGTLVLDFGTDEPPISLQWDGKAFNFVAIKTFATSGLEIIPSPPALNTVATRSLTSLNVDRGGQVSLDGTSFSFFLKLTDLSFKRTTFTSISADAFWNLGNRLINLDLSDTNLQTASPFAALSFSSNLQYLNLINSQLTSIPNKAFSALRNLQLLGLSDNNIAESINSGALDGLPPSLQILYINNVGLTEVPSRIIMALSSFNLNMANNKITLINSTDFKTGGNLKGVVLANNPISTIDTGAFWPLTSVSSLDLTNTQITEIDLSDLPNVFGCTSIFDSSALLKIMTVSDISKVSWTANILIRQTGLETIDIKINDLLRQKSLIQIDLSNNVKLKCDGLQWLASYALQSVPRVKIDGAACADYGIPLSQFLKGDYTTTTAPTTVPTTAPTTVPTTEPATTTTTTAGGPTTTGTSTKPEITTTTTTTTTGPMTTTTTAAKPH